MYVVFRIDTRVPIAWFMGQKDAAEYAETRFRCDYELMSIEDTRELMEMARKFSGI